MGAFKHSQAMPRWLCQCGPAGQTRDHAHRGAVCEARRSERLALWRQNVDRLFCRFASATAAMLTLQRGGIMFFSSLAPSSGI